MGGQGNAVSPFVLSLVEVCRRRERATINNKQSPPPIASSSGAAAAQLLEALLTEILPSCSCTLIVGWCAAANAHPGSRGGGGAAVGDLARSVRRLLTPHAHSCCRHVVRVQASSVGAYVGVKSAGVCCGRQQGFLLQFADPGAVVLAHAAPLGTA